MTIVGALARVRHETRERTCTTLSSIEGIEIFPVEDEARVGLLVESTNVEAALELLQGPVARVDGILGVFPISVHEAWDEAETCCSTHTGEPAGIPGSNT